MVEEISVGSLSSQKNKSGGGFILPRLTAHCYCSVKRTWDQSSSFPQTQGVTLATLQNEPLSPVATLCASRTVGISAFKSRKVTSWAWNTSLRSGTTLQRAQRFICSAPFRSLSWT